MRVHLLAAFVMLGAVGCASRDAAKEGQAFSSVDSSFPGDFKIVAKYDAGYSDWLCWESTISADGQVVQDIGPRRRGGDERAKKETKLSKDAVGALFAKVNEADFFNLKDQYKATATDLATLVLEVTAEKKTHRVLVYGHNFLTAKKDQDAVDRFLAVWSEVLRVVPAPNSDQKTDRYRPGNYRSRRD